MPVRKYLKETIKLGGRDLTVETGRVAKQADGSVVISYGDGNFPNKSGDNFTREVVAAMLLN